MTQTNDIVQAIRERRLKIGDLESQIVSLEGEIEKLAAAAQVMGVDINSVVEAPSLNFDDEPAPGDLTEAAKKYGFVKDTLKNYIKGLPTDFLFTVNDASISVLKAIPDFNLDTNKSNISSYLREFSGLGGAIEISEIGEGRTPTIYRKK